MDLCVNKISLKRSCIHSLKILLIHFNMGVNTEPAG